MPGTLFDEWGERNYSKLHKPELLRLYLPMQTIGHKDSAEWCKSVEKCSASCIRPWIDENYVFVFSSPPLCKQALNTTGWSSLMNYLLCRNVTGKDCLENQQQIPQYALFSQEFEHTGN